MAYDLRERRETSYKEDRLVLRREKVSKGRGSQDKLYELKVVERDRENHRVKVHYIGYDSDDDEWRSESDVKMLYPVQGEPCSKICA
jgi:hypothetical protein